MNTIFFNKPKGSKLYLLFLIFSLCQISCEEGRGVISDFNPDITVSTELYVVLGNSLHALKDNRINDQDFSKNSQIDPFWTAQIPGNLSVSTPFLVPEGQYQENKIYISSAGGWVYKYSNSGDLLWSYNTGGEISASVHVVSTIENPEPFVPYIFIGNKNGRFVCLDGVDGSVKWEHQIPSEAGIESSAQHIRKGNKHYIIFGSDDGFIYAFDAESGEKEWEHYTGASIQSKGESHKGNQQFVVGNVAGDVFNMDVASGNVVWSKKLPGPVFSTPETGPDGNLALGCNDGNLYMLNAQSGDILWEFQTDGSIYSSPYFMNVSETPDNNSEIIPMIYVSSFDEHLYAVNAYSGALIWKKNLDAGQLAASPIAFRAGGVNSIVYMNTSRGLVSVSARSGEYQSSYTSVTEGNYTSSVMPYPVLLESTIPTSLSVYPNNIK